MDHTTRILCATHSYVRYDGDILSDHILLLNKTLKEGRFEISVIAPHDDNLKRVEMIEDIITYRFRYFFKRYQRLAYRGNMQDLIVSRISNKVIFTFFLISFFVNMIVLLKKYSHDIIHAHWWIPSGFLSSVVSVIFRIPFIVTVHGTDARLLKQSALLRKLAKLTFRRASKIVCVSQNVREQLISIIGKVENKTAVIPMPANENVFKPVPSKNNSVYNILCVARFTRQKGVETLINACAKLDEHTSAWRLLLIGEGPLEIHLKERVKELKLNSKICFKHFVDKVDLSHYYNSCDVLVLPSVDEGFGLVLVEAQLCRKLVIGADSGGIRDIITDGVTGLLFTADSETDLYNTILLSKENKELSRKLADQGYNSAVTHFSSSSIARKYHSLYDSIRTS